MKNRTVSVIIVNWNGLEHLKKCLPSLSNQNHKDIEIVLVDNGSVDDSVNWVRKNYSKIKVVKNKTNLGFAEANNIGYENCSGNYVLFLNNDTTVSKDFLEPLLKALDDERIGCVQSKILFMDDPSKLDSVGSFFTSTGFLYHFGVYGDEGSPEFSKEMEVFSAKGACMMFRREVLEKVKLKDEIFDSRYFAYFEETDLCHRTWLAGYSVKYIPSSIIKHKFGATSQKLLKPFVEYHSYKNRINSYIKNLSLPELVKMLPVHLALCEGLALFFLLKGKWGISLAIHKAFFWNVTNLGETLLRRRIVQTKIRSVTDAIISKHIKVEVGPGYYLSMLSGWNVTKVNVDKKAN